MRYLRTCAVAVLVGLTACYTYVPASRPAPETDERIHANLTTRGAEATFGRFGRHVGSIRGKVLETSDSLLIALDGVWQPDGAELSWPDRFVWVSSDAIASYREQRLSWWRTAAFAVALAAMPATLDAIFGAGFIFPTSDDEGDDGQDSTR